MWYIYKMEYYSAIKNGIMPFAAIWIDFEIIILSDLSQTEKDKYHTRSLRGGLLIYATKKCIYKKETDSQTLKTNIWLPKGRVVGKGWVGGLGLAKAHFCIWNGWSTGTCCIAQRNLLNVL